MELLYTSVIGFVVGIVAKLVLLGKDPIGFILTTLLGMAGSVVASILGQGLNWYAEGEPAGFIASVFGAIIFLLLYRMIFGLANDRA